MKYQAISRFVGSKYATKPDTSEAIKQVETKVKASVDDFKLAIIADFESKQHKNKDLIDEAIKAFSIKLKEKMQSASENMTTVEVKLESSVQDMKNALSSSHDNLQKQVLLKPVKYGSTGCGVFKRGIQYQKDSCISIPKGNY